MYGNREQSVLDEDVPDVPENGPDSTDGAQDTDALSDAERANLEAATRSVRQAVAALVPDITEVQSQVADTATGPSGLVVIQAPGLPPVGTTIDVETPALRGDPPLTEEEIREKATTLVARAVVIAREDGPEMDGLPAN